MVSDGTILDPLIHHHVDHPLGTSASDSLDRKNQSQTQSLLADACFAHCLSLLVDGSLVVEAQ